MSTWIVLDVSYLCWRAHHTTGTLTYNGSKTGVLFGVLRDILMFRSQMATDNFIFAFDLDEPTKRRELFPDYKRKSIASVRMDTADRDHVKAQRSRLMTEILPRIGYKNLLSASGFEADDMIAAAVSSLKGSDIEIISADKDLYQLLSENVSIYNPDSRKYSPYTTLKTFRESWGVEPGDWATVKALAGCNSDAIPGIEGVGEKTACKFLRGEMGDGLIKNRIIAQREASLEKNLPLTKLPFPGTPTVNIEKAKPDWQKFRLILEELGMKSLIGMAGKKGLL